MNVLVGLITLAVVVPLVLTAIGWVLMVVGTVVTALFGRKH